jgi:serine/threonine-protein kinase
MIETLGHYKILDRMAPGGLGDVYRARDTSLGRTVAITVVAAEIATDPDRREELLQDARAAAALSHPNVAALYEIGDDQRELFLVCEFVPGETLETAIAGRPLNTRRAIDLAVQIADGLAAAHAHGLVDGRIAPDTIIVTPKGHAKILDVGLGTWTRRGDAAAFKSPEQARGDRIDEKADLFSLGAVLFAMLTGRPPFEGLKPPAGTAAPTAPATSPVPSAANAAVPHELDRVVGKALANTFDRYESAATMAADLRTVAAMLDARSATAEPPRVVRAAAARRRRSVVGPVALILVAAVLASAGWWERPALGRAWRRAFGAAPKPVVAVLPLALSGADASRTFYADGLADDLITRLGQMPGVKVIGRSGLRGYRGRSPSVVARALGAAVMLTGSVHPTASDVTLNLALADPVEGDVLWSGEYTRPAGDIFALQEQAAEDIAQALDLRLQPSAATARLASRQVDRSAYELYLHGRQAMADSDAAHAATYYQEALATDAALPEAFAGLARALHSMPARSTADETARRERIKAAAERAYQLDPDLASANVAMAFASPTLPVTLQYLRRAIDLDPSNGDTYRDVADVIRAADPEMSDAFMARARALDPRPSSGTTTAGAAGVAGRPPAAGRRGSAVPASDRDVVRRGLAGLLESHQ